MCVCECGGGGLTSLQLPSHENSGENSVWEKRGGAKVERRGLRGWEAQSERE